MHLRDFHVDYMPFGMPCECDSHVISVGYTRNNMHQWSTGFPFHGECIPCECASHEIPVKLQGIT
jgi:hypothetical protein